MNMLNLLLGYCFSLFFGGIVLWVIFFAIRRSGKFPVPGKGKNPDAMSIWIGLLERFIFTTSVILGFEAFIGIWFLAKLALAWNIWKAKDFDEIKVKQRTDIGRIYLLGNGLSITFGVIGALIANGSIL